MKRKRKCTRTLRSCFGSVIRDIERKYPDADTKRNELLDIGRRFQKQKRHDKNNRYSIHAPAVECISKAKAHKRYEFGCKVVLPAASQRGSIVGCRAPHGDPNDGDTLAETLEQAERVAGKPELVFVDMGYRGHDCQGDIHVHVEKRRRGGNPRRPWRWMKRRAAIEPGIGHLERERRMGRSRLQGEEENFNAMPGTDGMTFAKLPRWPAVGLRFIFHAIVRCQRVTVSLGRS